jgi:hypothetical protein
LWNQAPAHRETVPLAKADLAATRADALSLDDEYTAAIPGSCHIVIKCGKDGDGYNYWVAKTQSGLKTVLEGQAFEIRCGEVVVRYDVGDRYFVVKHYERVNVGTDQARNVLPKTFTLSNKLEFVHNHLLLHYHGFDMPFTSRLWQAGGTQYTIGDGDVDQIMIQLR